MVICSEFHMCRYRDGNQRDDASLFIIMYFQIDHFLVFELMKCELFDHLNNVIRLDERQAKKIMRKILLAVQNLHENEIIHRDIKLVSLLSGSAAPFLSTFRKMC